MLAQGQGVDTCQVNARQSVQCSRYKHVTADVILEKDSVFDEADVVPAMQLHFFKISTPKIDLQHPITMPW